jgi:signal transduction histidine kinase/FixJ family two-component response regulator
VHQHMSNASDEITSQASQALNAQVQLSRTRMLMGHVPAASLMAGALAVLVVALVSAMLPGPLSLTTSVWLATTVLVSVVRTAHIVAYRRSSNQGSVRWRQSFVALTFLFGACWGAMMWALPIRGHAELVATAIGAVIGLAAAGASMANMDKTTAHAWLGPTLLSSALYAASANGPLGWFGFISITGFGLVLWVEANRSHRRMDEMLHLRYESEQLAVAREKALLEAESLSAAKGRFLATMSHEMRTPLHGILGLSRMLRTELSNKGNAHAQMTLLQNAGEHLLCVINDVLDFSRLKEGRLTLKPAPILLHKLVREVCELADVNAQAKGLVVTLHTSLPENLWVEADADRLKQILINLVGNAVKFTEQGHVIVRLRPASQSPQGKVMVVFEVEDTGNGIPTDQLSRIFDAFHQVDARDERQAGGSGLGLSIAQQLCKAMHGDIRCESRLGIGSTFRFALPLPCLNEPAQANAQLSTEPAIKEPELPLFGHVLLVEDNPVNALVAQAALEKLGLNVHLADNGQTALDWLAQHKADLILMDCHMPQMGGIEATKRIRAIEQDHRLAPTPIVAMSASNQAEDHRLCLSVGMDDFISKPFAPAELARTLRRHLQNKPRSAKRTSASNPALHQTRSAIQLP